MMRALELIGSVLAAPEVIALVAFAVVGMALSGAFYLFVKAWLAI